ncbi:MAG TPA: hypothetical protein VMP89_00600 [Solirubrobacteraceae bacterium]|nr:hypothetical protein [Solirubrobacteraceae bacterium]
MRRVLFVVLFGSALLAFGPASALARHHRSSHRSSHHRIRFERWGSNDASQSSAPTSSNQNAGTVSSFANGVLTITLNDANHSMVSGTVTPNTEVKCEAPESSSDRIHADGDGGGNTQSGGSDDNEDNNAGNAGEEQGQQNCMTALETSGTVVREAELRLSGSGASWDKVELITQPATTTTTDDNDANENESNDS